MYLHLHFPMKDEDFSEDYQQAVITTTQYLKSVAGAEHAYTHTHTLPSPPPSPQKGYFSYRLQRKRLLILTYY